MLHRFIALAAVALAFGCTNESIGSVSEAARAPGCTSNADCSDGVYCNGAESCQAGRCVSGTTVGCGDSAACTFDLCDESIRACRHIADHSACPAGQMCAGAAGCGAAGTCATDADCDDHSMCNGAERCVAGLCVGSTPPACDDGIACTSDVCTEARGCVHTPVDLSCGWGMRCGLSAGCEALPDCATNTDCDDNVFCNGAERCEDSRCYAGARPTVSDDVACTVDICEEATRTPVHVSDDSLCDVGQMCRGRDGCVGECRVDSDCDDNSFCNGTETCVASQCVRGARQDCDDGDGFTADLCDDAAAACSHIVFACAAGSVPHPDHTMCDACPAGTYSATGDATCTPCRGDTWSEAGAATCSTCPAGLVPDSEHAACVMCPDGSYKAEGIEGCTPCGGGYVSNETHTGCNLCDAGTYSGAASCLPCTGTTYAPFPGAWSCTDCTGGLPNETHTYCMPCAAGTYRAYGESACTECPADAYCPDGTEVPVACASGYTSPAGSDSALDCQAICDVGVNYCDSICVDTWHDDHHCGPGCEAIDCTASGTVCDGAGYCEAAGQFAPRGVVNDFKVADLAPYGFTRCYDAAYSDASTLPKLVGTCPSDLLSPTSNGKYDIVLGCYEAAHPDVLSTMAVLPNSILYTFTPGAFSVVEGSHDSDWHTSVYWYHRPSYVLGISGDQYNYMDYCDPYYYAGYNSYYNQTPRSHMCWYMDGYNAGYRCGDATSTGSDYRKVLYYRLRPT